MIVLCIVIRVRRLSNINEVSEHFSDIIEHLSTDEIAIAGEIKNNKDDINEINSKLGSMSNKIDSTSSNNILKSQQNGLLLLEPKVRQK